MMQRPKALIFDLNGTMIDDMSYHIKAWHGIVTNFGVNFTMEQMKAQCYGKNGEILERIFPGRFSDEEKDQIEIEKETAYQEVYRPHMKLIAGLDVLLQTASQQQVKLGIGSAAIMYNVSYILDGLGIRDYFGAIISANEVAHSKPDPETFLKCAAELQVAPADCIVFEDAPKGVEAALNAGMQTVVLTTMHTEAEFSSYSNIIGFVSDYTNPLIQQLLA